MAARIYLPDNADMGKNASSIGDHERLLTQIRHGMCLLVVLAALAVLDWASGFFVLLAFGIMLTLCLNPLVARLQRIGVPRALGAALVLIAVIALAIAAILSLQSDAQDLMAQLPASMRHFRQMLLDAANDNSGWWHRLNVIARSAGATPAMTSSPTALPVPVIKDGLAATVVQGSLGVASLLGQLSIVLFLVYFLLIAPLPVIGAARRPAQEFIGEIAKQVQRYIGVLVVTNILLGLLTWLAFALLGVSHAAVWGLGAAVLHFIPYAGAAGTAAGAGLAATVQFESIGTGLLIAAVSLSLSTLVGIALATWLTGRTAKMSTAPLFVGLLFWGWLWGLPGLLLGAPMMMALRAAADRIPTLEWLSRLLRADPHAVATRLPPR